MLQPLSYTLRGGRDLTSVLNIFHRQVDSSHLNRVSIPLGRLYGGTFSQLRRGVYYRANNQVILTSYLKINNTLRYKPLLVWE